MKYRHPSKSPAVLILLTALSAAVAWSCTPEPGWNSDFILTTNLKIDTAYSGETIEAGETVYYDFVSVADDVHTISVTNLTTDVGWDLFEYPSYCSPGVLVSSNAVGLGNETAGTGVLVHATKYYIAVTEYDDTGGVFDIIISYP